MPKPVRLLSQLKSAAPRLPLARALAPLPQASRRLLRAVAAQAESSRLPLYIVGGYVRDVILGRPSLDLDLVVEGDAIAFGRQLQRALGGELLAHKTFGTAVWRLAPGRGLPEFVDLISARRESYARPGALPAVQFSNIADDQFRRDFTINTLALRLDGAQAGQILDAWGGLADLRACVIRVLHDQSFSDDPTRIFRALRFSGRLGFALERKTQQQLRANVNRLDAVSGERIYNEIDLILQEPKRVQILASLQKYGVLRAIHLKLQWNAAMARALAHIQKPAKVWGIAPLQAELGLVVWLAQHAPTTVEAVARRLRLTAELAAAARAASGLRAQARKLAGMPNSALTFTLQRAPQLAVYALYLLQRNTPLAARLLAYSRRWRSLQPYADGNTLTALGLKPGKAYGHILQALRAAWLDGKVKTRKQEAALLERLLREQY
ncbi:MAG: CCA tRNA nucleotidyltransferase [Anaerolineales bacterium]|nr:MAG: CCA tRNA nucleotidyltransferase [Anaerolineales bacterium]